LKEKKLLKGNIALAEGAVIAGMRYYFGYPITPQNEIPEYMSWRLPEVGGDFVQAESEVASINMVFGAAAAGARAMTTTSSPGFSLMMEGLSYLAGAHLPCVVANIQRAGPGLGNITVSQGDYFQAVKGGGHGDYRMIVLAPDSPQEMMDQTILAFELADKYLTPVCILSDGVVGQMVETVEMREPVKNLPEKPWALTGCAGRDHNIVRSLWLDDNGVPDNNRALQKKYQLIEKNEKRFEGFQTEDAEIIVAAYGLSSRIARNAVVKARENGIKAGLFRPITLWPYPSEELQKFAAGKAKAFFTVEMSAGQMVEDVKLAVNGRAPVYFSGALGGDIPDEDDLYEKIVKINEGKAV
jgi:2-oxoglutarate ferredoxin oxidoreductase subunit alpha